MLVNFVTTVSSALIFRQYILHVPKCIKKNQYKIVKGTRLEFKRGIAYLTPNSIVSSNDSLQRSNEAFKTKM